MLFISPFASYFQNGRVCVRSISIYKNICVEYLMPSKVGKRVTSARVCVCVSVSVPFFRFTTAENMISIILYIIMHARNVQKHMQWIGIELSEWLNWMNERMICEWRCCDGGEAGAYCLYTPCSPCIIQIGSMWQYYRIIWSGYRVIDYARDAIRSVQLLRIAGKRKMKERKIRRHTNRDRWRITQPN